MVIFHSFWYVYRKVTNNSETINWLVVSNMNFMFPYFVGIIQSDELIFFGGLKPPTSKQCLITGGHKRVLFGTT